MSEGAPELKGLDPKERRRRFIRAARASYKSWKTWLGLVVFITVTSYSSSIGRYIHEFMKASNIRFFGEGAVSSLVTLFATFILWKCQDSVIREELRKEPQPCNRAYR
jgi:hypothetical protein